MHRFFVNPEALRRQPVLLTGDQAHQVRRVLRLRPGDRVTLLDGRGSAYEAVLVTADDRAAHFRLGERRPAGGEPAVKITLCQAVLKGERFPWALQKATEIGVSRFVPLICDRNVVGDSEAVNAKRERWERIIREAAEQSGRGLLPELATPRQFRAAVEEPAANTLRLIPYEGERVVRLSGALDVCNWEASPRIQVYVGPEGGFTQAEIDFAREHGAQPVTLGARILRAETAGIVAASAILFRAGEF